MTRICPLHPYTPPDYVCEGCIGAVNKLVAQYKAEVEMLRGVGCREDGDGPCGVCLKCVRIQGAAEEREACAVLVDNMRCDSLSESRIITDAVGAIRARGDK